MSDIDYDKAIQAYADRVDAGHLLDVGWRERETFLQRLLRILMFWRH